MGGEVGEYMGEWVGRCMNGKIGAWTWVDEGRCQ